uniref:NADH dehydrogenase subunit 5 n=1 Tax=Melasis buprestoides TaxID=195231 RepID=I7FBE2_9COLE|nr:NADH dehydrogenase subunit 5 [Melasis buprestoides]
MPSGSMLSWLMLPSPYFICLPVFMKFLVLLVILFGLWVGYEFSLISINYFNKSKKMFFLTTFFGSMWFMPSLSTYIIKFPLFLGGVYYKIFDHGWAEFVGAQNIYFKLSYNSGSLTNFFSFNVKVFLFFYFYDL